MAETIIMKIVEYKRHLINGCIVDPEFIHCGGHFFNPADSTWIGAILDETARLYYVPDGIVELTRATLIQRQQAIHAASPFKKLLNPNDPHGPRADFTDTDITNLVDDFLNLLNTQS